MPRYKLVIEYDGGGFNGWQRQEEGVPTVQQTLEDAFLKFCDEKPVVHGSGRTDTGVHARGMVAHVELARDWPPHRLQGALNWHVRPAPVSVLAVEPVADDWHARFSCKGRRYLYRILVRRGQPVLEAGRVWYMTGPLDHEAMQEAARHLIGQHDFTTFRAAMCQAASPVKTLGELRVEKNGEEIHIHAAARSFLHHQVRNMVGSLSLVGLGRWSPDHMRTALEARNRSAGGPTAPACGLYFMDAWYE
jgi:tRNA pseudouridine38-40 synthase